MGMGLFRKRPGGRGERGAVIALTAIALPFLLACIGLAIDLGNLYVHKSRLQNAADAAVLAGSREFAAKGETAAEHPKADVMAEAYVKENAVKRNIPGAGIVSRYQAQAADNVTYYRVALTEEVPLFFLRFIKTTQSVSADAAAAIPMTSLGEPPEELFIFTRRLVGVNAVENPDTNKPGQLATTFDGRIAFTDGSGSNAGNGNGYTFEALQYSAQSTPNNPIEYFYTSKARNEKLSLKQAEQKQKELDKDAKLKFRFSAEAYAFREIFKDFNMDALGSATRKSMGLPDYVETPEPGGPDGANAGQGAAAKQPKSAGSYADSPKFNGKKDMVSSDLTQDLAWTARNGDGNVSVTIDKALPGGADADPVYVYLDRNITQVNLLVNADNGRPLILVYEGAGSLRVDMASGRTFRGVVYAPHADAEGVLVNVNGGTFSGSIIAGAIDLQGGKGSFVYEDFGIGGGGTAPDAAAKPRLVPSKSVKWE